MQFCHIWSCACIAPKGMWVWSFTLPTGQWRMRVSQCLSTLSLMICTWKWMVGRLVSLWDIYLAGTILGSGRVMIVIMRTMMMMMMRMMMMMMVALHNLQHSQLAEHGTVPPHWLLAGNTHPFNMFVTSMQVQGHESPEEVLFVIDMFYPISERFYYGNSSGISPGEIQCLH